MPCPCLEELGLSDDRRVLAIGKDSFRTEKIDIRTS
jgi:hypothetical protein